MPSLQVLLAFFGLCVVLALSPGPDNLFVLVQSAQRGWRVGLAVVVGLCIGILGHTIAVASGPASGGCRPVCAVLLTCTGARSAPQAR